MNINECPLCECSKTRVLLRSCAKNLERDYIVCDLCELIFVPSQFHLSKGGQKDRYLQHNNDSDDCGYRGFLSRLSQELIPHLNRGSRGIDYGSGPGPVLAIMLREDGFNMQTFDPLFQPDRSVLSNKYSFITCTETVEHFGAPKLEFHTMDDILEPGGWIGIMTGMLENRSNFEDWYYLRDPTHIAFYNKNTMCFIGSLFDWEIHFPADNIVLFHKPF